MKINNEFLVNSFFEMHQDKNEKKEVDSSTGFQAALDESLLLKKIAESNEISNGDSFRKEIVSNVFEGGGWAYVDKYGFSHVVSDYKTASQFKMPGTDVYQYNGRYGGGYALDQDQNRMRVALPNEVPFGNDIDEEPQHRAKIADSRYIGEAVNYTKYLDLMARILERPYI